MEKPRIRISVRGLVEFLLRSGDIDNRRGWMAQKEAMREGSRIHRKIQHAMGPSYHAEVPLRWEMDCGPYVLCVEGRADGIIIGQGNAVVDEIKGVYRDVALMEEPVPVHLAQAKCYAYFYGSQNGCAEIGVRLTYCNLDTEEIRYFEETCDMPTLEGWFLGLVGEYQKWADFQYEARQERQASIQGLEFPFPYRAGQRELVAGVYRTICRGKILFLQAPTGTGKTISTVFPAVRAIGEGHGEKIFYLTAKTVTRTVAKEAYALLRKHGYRGSVLEITAKEKLCLCGEMECNPQDCPYAKGHYDRINDAVFALIHREKDITREVLLSQAEESRVCPFELCLDTAVWMDNILCDYNYVFDPNVCLRRFFSDEAKGEYLFLVDEAHNLVERGREMYSASLYKEDFLEMKKLLKGYSAKAVRALDKCNRLFLEEKRNCEGYRVLSEIGDLGLSLRNLGAAMDEFLQKSIEHPQKKRILEFYFALRHFLNMYDRLDENYVVYAQHEEDGRFLLRLYCVNPAASLQECLDRGWSTVFFSATLLPIQYYKALLSTREDNYAVYAQSVFSPEQSLVLVAGDVSSKYSRRNEREFSRIAGYIKETVAAKKGNYMAFFPSYRLLGQTLEACRECGLDADLLVQEPGMREREREEFLEAFSQERERPLVGFCVLGGIFAEGIDLKAERLIGAIVVGTGLPQVCNEREILREYYDGRGEDGFGYAYRFPGMNKVMQAAGRVIRTVGDRGVILLLDERFLRQEYRCLFPREWAGYEPCTRKNVGMRLRDFWED